MTIFATVILGLQTAFFFKIAGNEAGNPIAPWLALWGLISLVATIGLIA